MAANSLALYITSENIPIQFGMAGSHALDPRRSPRRAAPSKAALHSRRTFLRNFPDHFQDETYLDWERDYKWKAHQQWEAVLSRSRFRSLLREGKYQEIAQHAVRIESRTNLLFSFEKMALRDAVKSREGSRIFATGLYDFLYGPGAAQQRFERWVGTISRLPRKQTRVLTWPLVTVFGFIAQPDQHIFLKPQVTKVAAEAYGFEFDYLSRPNWKTYQSMMSFAAQVEDDISDLEPRDLIDIQSFIWVLGSDEY
jgi:hypothetical protein